MFTSCLQCVDIVTWTDTKKTVRMDTPATKYLKIPNAG